MKFQQVIIEPITTPKYPDPTEVRRYIEDPDGWYGYDYIFLEDATWNALCGIARERGCTVGELCGDIELNFAPGEDFAQAARYYVLHHLACKLDKYIELPVELSFLTEPGDRRRVQ